MIKRILPLFFVLVLLGAGCSLQSANEGDNFDLTAIEAELGMDLPDDSEIDVLTEIPGYYNVIAYTDMSWEEVRDSFHAQLVADGYDDTISGAEATLIDLDEDVIIASYLKQTGSTGPDGIQSRAWTVGVEDGRTKYSVLKQ